MSERKYRHPQVNLRLPNELKIKVAEWAEFHGRSANAEMVKAIEEWIRMCEESKGCAIITMKDSDLEEFTRSIAETVKEDLMKKFDLKPKKSTS